MADCTEAQRVSDILPLEGALTQGTHFIEEKTEHSPQEQKEKYRHPLIETPTYGATMLTAIGDVMRRVYERGWITTRDGNISMRKREEKYLYITLSGWRKTILRRLPLNLSCVSRPKKRPCGAWLLADSRPMGSEPDCRCPC